MRQVQSAGRGGDEFELSYYISILWRRKLLIALALVLVVGGALAYTARQPRVYRSSAAVLLQGNLTEEVLFPARSGQVRLDNEARVANEIEVMLSKAVRDAAGKELGHAPDVSASRRGETSVVEIVATSSDPEDAAKTAQTYAEVFIRLQRERLAADLQKAIDQVQGELDQINAQIKQLEAPLAELGDQIVAEADQARREQLETRRDLLDEQLDAQISGLRTRAGTYESQIVQLRLASKISETGGVQLISGAEVPSKPAAPNPTRNASVALSLGLVLGVALAFVREYYDDSIRSKQDIERLPHRIPVVGVIPSIRSWRGRSNPLLVSRTAPASPAAEAYRRLRTSIQFLAQKSVRIIQITSPHAGDGKTTTVANLAVALARAGRRVVLVDCNLRHPRLHVFFHLGNLRGFTSVLSGDSPLADVVKRVPEVPGLAVVVSGPTPTSDPSELLSSKGTPEVLNQLADDFDYVLVDGPPFLPVTDAAVLAGAVDAVLVVFRAGVTAARSAEEALELLAQVEAPVVGAVLNRSRGSTNHGSLHASDGDTGKSRNSIRLIAQAGPR